MLVFNWNNENLGIIWIYLCKISVLENSLSIISAYIKCSKYEWKMILIMNC